MKKFIRGSFLILENVTNKKQVKGKYHDGMMKIAEFANTLDFAVNLGFNTKNELICEYEVLGNTTRECTSIVNELKDNIKQVFGKRPICVFQAKGEKIY